MPDCNAIIQSNDFYDFLVPLPYEQFKNEFADNCIIPIGQYDSVIYVNKEQALELNYSNYVYTSIPKCYGLMDVDALNAAGVYQIQNQPFLNLKGQGVMIGFIDTGIDYRNDVSKDTIIIADPEQLKRVINNIVGNSVKYMAARPGRIGIHILNEPEFVQVEIWDNGKGIAKKELPRIFERCYRTDASRNSSKGGSGLGLSIAKKIIEEHGGKIWANSVEGEGTTISFVLRKYKECVTYE